MASRPGTFALKGAENEEMLLAAPPHLTAQDLLILVTKGGQVRAVGSSRRPPAPKPRRAARRASRLTRRRDAGATPTRQLARTAP